MSRLIDAEKLPLEPKEANQFIPYEYASGWNDMLLNVLKAEQIDAVHVVRCRECIHYETGVCLKIYDDGAASSYAWQKRNPDDFCSYGERKKVLTDGLLQP